ncbi:glycosyltransferase family 2 protein [Microbacterium sp. JZ31]|uniref:glycosyltransferase family 2 protein n=1 Tax=Microbacterium sp. JZ31 TaxID=1906274 RepID=UPI0019318FF2|nr:glycosyltransferase family 2 protein [Microbacterium sp. JZ31]
MSRRIHDAHAAMLEATRLAPKPPLRQATVTVVIPCFNYARYVEQAVHSALNQGGVTVEVIVVDDASTDDSLAVLRRLAEEDPRVHVLANETNRGPVATFNRGLAAATGEYLVRLDADDLLTPGALLRAAAVLQHLPEVGLVYGHPLHFLHGRGPARTKATGWTVWQGRAWLATRCASGDNVITSPEVVMRRSVLDEIGGQRDLAHTHDMEHWLRIAAHADVAYLEGCDQAWHREHEGSLSTRADEPIVFLREANAAFETLCDQLSGAEDLRLAARRGVALAALRYARRDVDRGRISEVAELLRDLALELDAGVLATREGGAFASAWRRASTWPHAAARISGLVPLVRRRRWSDARWRRWRRTGVYEPLRIVSAAPPQGAPAPALPAAAPVSAWGAA